MQHAGQTRHAEDDDWGQAGTLVREVLDDAACNRLVDNIVGHLLDGVTEPVLARAFEYMHNIDADLGDRIEAGVRARRGRRSSDVQAVDARMTASAYSRRGAAPHQPLTSNVAPVNAGSTSDGSPAPRHQLGPRTARSAANPSR